jgi:hypothetical protein
MGVIVVVVVNTSWFLRFVQGRGGVAVCHGLCWQLSALFDVVRRGKTLLATSLYLHIV